MQLIIVLIVQEIVRYLIFSLLKMTSYFSFFQVFNYITKDPCFPNICLNGGTCTTVNGLATCTCPAYFTGSRCDQCKLIFLLILKFNKRFFCN